MNAPTRCEHCSEREPDSLHVARCEFLDQIKQRLALTADQHGVPRAQVLDLWAHLRSIRDDGLVAYRQTVKVIELGWRPGDE